MELTAIARPGPPRVTPGPAANQQSGNLWWLMGLALCALAVPTSAAAQEAVALVAPDPWEVIHTAREFGPAEVALDGMQDPQIRGTIDGVPYRLTFYGCRLGRDCDTILFDARFSRHEWQEDAPSAKLFAEWNAGKLFGRAWLDDEDRAVLDHPVALAQGMPPAVLHATFQRWRVALTEYTGWLGFR